MRVYVRPVAAFVATHGALFNSRVTHWCRTYTVRSWPRSQVASRILSAVLALCISALTAGCSPEVGSDAWCSNMAEKPKGDWTANEAANYARHCLFR